MTLRQNTAEGGTVGQAVTPANSGGASGTAFDNVNVGAGSALLFSNSFQQFGTRAIAVTAAASEVAFVEWTGFSNGRLATRMYLYIPQLPEAALQLMQPRSASVNIGRIVLTAEAKLVIQNSQGTSIFTSPAIPLSTWVRIEVQWEVGTSTANGVVNFAWYLGESRDAQITATRTDVNLGTAPVTVVRFGKPAATSVPTSAYYVRGLAMNDGSNVAIGPLSATPTPPTVSAGQDLTREVGSSPFQIAGVITPTSAGATISQRSWTQVSGPTTALGNASTATVTVTPPATTTGVAVYRLTATDSNGLTSSDDVAVSFVAQGQRAVLVGDVATGGWTSVPNTSPLAGAIDEATRDDADYILSPSNPVAGQAVYVGRVGPLRVGSTLAGWAVTISVGLAEGNAAHAMKATMRQGTTVVATRTWTDLTATVVDKQIVLTSDEAAKVTDGENLLIDLDFSVTG